MYGEAVEYENQILLGDCLEVLKQIPDETFDAAVTDVPYGLGDTPTPEEILAYLHGADLKTGDFMSKDWDIPSVAVWREMYRVLKPGAHCFAFGGTRTSDLVSLGARMAGFVPRDSIRHLHADADPNELLWLYGSGMPKSTNVSKQIDKKKGAKRKVLGPDEDRRKRANKGTDSPLLPSYSKARAAQAEAVLTEPSTLEAQQADGLGTGLKPSFEPILMFRKPFKGSLTENVLAHGTGALNIDVCRVKHASPEDFEKHKSGVDAIKSRGGSMQNSWKNSSDLSGANDVTSAGRWPPNVVLSHASGCQQVGTKKVSTGGSGAVPVVHASAGYKGPSLGRDSRKEGDVRLTHRNEDGSETVDAYDCVSGCPVRELDLQSGDRPSTLTGRADPNGRHENPGDNHGKSSFGGGNSAVYADSGGASRFFPQFQPDVWECEDGCPVKELDEQSGITTSGAMKHEVPGYEGESATGFIRGRSGPSNQHGDTGGASRFFPQFEGAPFLYTNKVSKKEATLDGQIENDHVSKKPLALMSWLVKLATPEHVYACPDRCVGETVPHPKPGHCPSCGKGLKKIGGLVLDPYCGSGSTLHAAAEAGFRYTGIERDTHYHCIATKRLQIVLDRVSDRSGQEDLFDLATTLE